MQQGPEKESELVIVYKKTGGIMVYFLQNLRHRQKTSDIDNFLVIQYKYYKIREVGGKIMYQKGQYIIYGIRGVCEVMDIITVDRPDGPKDRLYYVLRPYYQQDSKIVAPVDSEKTITRPLLSKEEALELIDKISDVKEMEGPMINSGRNGIRKHLRPVTAGCGSA